MSCELLIFSLSESIETWLLLKEFWMIFGLIQVICITFNNRGNDKSVSGYLTLDVDMFLTCLTGNTDGSFCPKVLLPYFPEGNLLHYLSKPGNPQDYVSLQNVILAHEISNVKLIIY